MQDSYVLCKLFKKLDERGSNLIREEVQDSSFSPPQTESSPSQKHLADDPGEESVAPSDRVLVKSDGEDESKHFDYADSVRKFPLKVEESSAKVHN